MQQPLNVQGTKVLFKDPQNPSWDCDRPWYKIPRAQQTCTRCYSSNHVQATCPLPHAFCDSCTIKNHHPAVCYQRLAPEQRPILAPSRAATTNRGAAAATAVGQSVLKTQSWDQAGEEASRLVIEEKVQNAIEKLTKAKPEKSEFEKRFEHIHAYLSSSEHDEYDNLLNQALNRQDIGAMEMIFHKVVAARSSVDRKHDFSVYEHTYGMYVQQLSVTRALLRLFICGFVLTLLSFVVLLLTSPTHTCVPVYGRSEPGECVQATTGYPKLMWLWLILMPLVFGTFLYRTGIHKIWWLGEILVKHSFSLVKADAILTIASSVNNRHPMFRYGKTLESACPMEIKHDVSFYIPARRPLTWYVNMFQLISDWMLWKFYLRPHPGSIQLDHQFWRPVQTKNVRGLKNLHHVLSADPRAQAHQLSDLFPNLGPSVEGRVIDLTRYDAFSSLPNIAASKSWEDACRNIEIVVKTCSWTAENWRIFGPDAPSALSNLLAYRWVATTFESRPILRHDLKWAF